MLLLNHNKFLSVVLHDAVQAVRLHEMAYAELQSVDGHPLVCVTSPALMAVLLHSVHQPRVLTHV